METLDHDRVAAGPTSGLAQRFWLLSRRILRYANRGVPRLDFMRDMSALVLEFSHCDSLELRLWGPDLSFRWQAFAGGHRRDEIERLPVGDALAACRFPRHPTLERIASMVVQHSAPPGLDCFTHIGSFWTGDARIPVRLGLDHDPIPLGVADDTRSLALTAFAVDDTNSGLLLLESAQPGLFTAEHVEYYEAMAQTLGLAVADRRAQAALRERVKELTCLYGLVQLVEHPGTSIDEALAGTTGLLVEAFQHPDRGGARVVLDGHDHRSPRFEDNGPCLSAPITIGNQVRGEVSVCYPPADEEIESDPFLPEEKPLLETVARQLAVFVERRQAESDKARLQEQLLHADRLATIGQLAAGIAHELNEPLANVLGFAQLAAKAPDVPDATVRDIGMITRAALHAREVIRKLMLFARQQPPQTIDVSLNELVEEGLYFLEGRCVKGGVELIRRLEPGLPEVAADPGQLLQVLINLVVNAIQAMPKGGRLTLTTYHDLDRVTLEVTDTGVGMTEDVRRKVFLPFYTTKDVSEGTGLGLAVVDGIVSAHGGTVEVSSKVGVGSSFRIHLPRGTDPGKTEEQHDG